jgi:hypothetical protein
VLGLALGIVVSLTTDVPFAPEAGVALGAFLGWLSRQAAAVTIRSRLATRQPPM